MLSDRNAVPRYHQLCCLATYNDSIAFLLSRPISLRGLKRYYFKCPAMSFGSWHDGGLADCSSESECWDGSDDMLAGQAEADDEDDCPCDPLGPGTPVAIIDTNSPWCGRMGLVTGGDPTGKLTISIEGMRDPVLLHRCAVYPTMCDL